MVPPSGEDLRNSTPRARAASGVAPRLLNGEDMTTSRALASLAGAAALLFAACKPEPVSDQPTSPVPGAVAPGAVAAAPAAAAPSADPAAQATEIFATRCTPCHGAEGRGDGVASASLIPKPRNFHDAAWQSSVQDDYLAKIIQYGGAAVGKSPTMPANPDLRDPAVIQALALHVRSLAKNP
jgi:mono/diheme cytochrome c family protein